MTPIRALVSRFIEKETHLDSVFKTLTFIIIIRVFLEMLLERRHSLRFSPDYYVNLIGYIHMYVFWLCVFSAIIILAVAILRLKYMEALRLVLLFSPLILIPPIIDFVSTRGEGGLIYGFRWHWPDPESRCEPPVRPSARQDSFRQRRHTPSLPDRSECHGVHQSIWNDGLRC